MASRIFYHVEALRASRLHQRLPEWRQEGLLSAGGPGGGGVWTQLPDEPRGFFPTAHFRVASLRRMGLLLAPLGATCALQTKGDGNCDVCGKVLDQHLLHPLLCDKGPAKVRVHTAVCHVLSKELSECKAMVDMERVVPDLMQVVERDTGKTYIDAILDLVVCWPGQVQPAWLDVTIRCPHAVRYPVAHARAGHAAAVGEQDKERRYGKSVLPVALESYGRLGTFSKECLEVLALQAGTCIGDHWALPRLVPRWIARLQRAVIFAVADVDLLALGANVSTLSIAVQRSGGLRGSA